VSEACHNNTRWPGVGSLYRTPVGEERWRFKIHHHAPRLGNLWPSFARRVGLAIYQRSLNLSLTPTPRIPWQLACYPSQSMWGSPVTETYCIMRLHSRQWHSACSPWTRSRAARQQGAEPERRIGAFLIAMVLGRRRVTLVVNLAQECSLHRPL
jgi:hypothetical protein